MYAICLKCGHEWDYTGHKRENTVCPRCHKNVMLSSKEKRYALLNLAKHGRSIEHYLKDGKKSVILDIVGPNVVSISEF